MTRSASVVHFTLRTLSLFSTPLQFPHSSLSPPCVNFSLFYAPHWHGSGRRRRQPLPIETPPRNNSPFWSSLFSSLRTIIYDYRRDNLTFTCQHLTKTRIKTFGKEIQILIPLSFWPLFRLMSSQRVRRYNVTPHTNTHDRRVSR